MDSTIAHYKLSESELRIRKLSRRVSISGLVGRGSPAGRSA